LASGLPGTPWSMRSPSGERNPNKGKQFPCLERPEISPGKVRKGHV